MAERGLDRPVARLRARRAGDARRRRSRGRGIQHYGTWLLEHHPEHVDGFAAAAPGRGRRRHRRARDEDQPDPARAGTTPTGSPIARSRWLDSLDADDDWFVWMSFPDPHHPWDPPASELHARAVARPRPAARPSRLARRDPRRPRAEAARTGSAWYEGTWRNVEGGPGALRARDRSTDDQIREINAHDPRDERADRRGVRPRARRPSSERGWDDDTDVFFTTDHGELQGDFGLLFKGPFHTDALMRLPFVWRPAPSAGVAPAEVAEPVGQLDLAPTFCAIAGVEPAGRGCRARRCRRRRARGRERVLCEWDSQFPGYGMHLRSIYRDGWLCTAYEPSTVGEPNGLEEFLGRCRSRSGRSARSRSRARRVRRHRGRAVRRRRGPAPVPQPLGRPRLRGRCERTSSPTSTTACPPGASRSSPSRGPA